MSECGRNSENESDREDAWEGRAACSDFAETGAYARATAFTGCRFSVCSVASIEAITQIRIVWSISSRDFFRSTRTSPLADEPLSIQTIWKHVALSSQPLPSIFLLTSAQFLTEV